jgi:CHAT domain-containing protein
MAIKLMTLAFETPYKPTPKVILLTLCDNANDQGECYPSLKTLSIKSSVGTSNLNYVLNALETIQLISREQRKRKNGSNTSTLYRINLSKLLTVAHSNGEDRKAYLLEYETVYKKIIAPKNKMRKNQNLDKGSNQNLDKGKNQILDKLIQPIGQLYEPLVNRQGDIKISPLSKRADFLKSQNSFINYMRATFKNKTINTEDQYTGKKIQVAISDKGYLYDKNTGESFSGTRALEMWEKLYKFAIKNPLLFINQNKEETA